MAASSDAEGLARWSSGSTDAARTVSGSTTHWRPQRKASLLASTAAPLSSIACSIASAAMGRQPSW